MYSTASAYPNGIHSRNLRMLSHETPALRIAFSTRAMMSFNGAPSETLTYMSGNFGISTTPADVAVNRHHRHYEPRESFATKANVTTPTRPGHVLDRRPGTHMSNAGVGSMVPPTETLSPAVARAVHKTRSFR